MPRDAQRRLGLTETQAGCIREWRELALVAHMRPAMPCFRMFAIACGYENVDDCGDHCTDPLFMYGCPRACKRLVNCSGVWSGAVMYQASGMRRSSWPRAGMAMRGSGPYQAVALEAP